MHTRAFRADTPPFLPEVHGGRKRPRERRRAKHVGAERSGVAVAAGGRGEVRVGEKKRARIAGVTSGGIYRDRTHEAPLLRPFLPLSDPHLVGGGGGGGGSCFTLFDFFKIYPYRFLAKSLSGRNLRSGNNTGGAPGRVAQSGVKTRRKEREREREVVSEEAAGGGQERGRARALQPSE